MILAWAFAQLGAIGFFILWRQERKAHQETLRLWLRSLKAVDDDDVTYLS